MRAFAHASLLAASLLALDGAALANDGLYLPQSPTGVGGEDSIETPEGTRCRQSMNNNGAYADMGVVGNKTGNDRSQRALIADERDYALAYARVTIPIGHRPRRIDCTRLYDMEIARLRREIELLKMNPE